MFDVLCTLMGVCCGAIITWYARGVEIDRALDSVGIKRVEFNRLKKRYEANELEVEALKDRLAQLMRAIDLTRL